MLGEAPGVRGSRFPPRDGDRLVGSRARLIDDDKFRYSLTKLTFIYTILSMLAKTPSGIHSSTSI